MQSHHYIRCLKDNPHRALHPWHAAELVPSPLNETVLYLWRHWTPSSGAGICFKCLGAPDLVILSYYLRSLLPIGVVSPLTVQLLLNLGLPLFGCMTCIWFNVGCQMKIVGFSKLPRVGLWRCEMS